MKLLLLFISVLLSSYAISDSYGSYDYSLKKYPDITKLLNSEPDSEDHCYVNVHMENDGIVNLGKTNKSSLLLVNYICANNVATNYYSQFFEVNQGSYEISNIVIPFLSDLEHEGNRYSLHKQSTEIVDGKLNVIYSFACKHPSSFVEIGDCSDSKVYTARLAYSFGSNGLQISETKITL